MRGVALALMLAALALTGCETTAQKSAKLERAAKQREAELGVHAQQGLSITHLSTKVQVSATAVLHSSEGAAAVVSLRNTSNTPLHDIPIAIAVKNAHDATIYTNATPGLAAALTSASSLPAHGELTWVDDQVQASSTPASVSARVGEATAASGTLPQLSVREAHIVEEPSGGPGLEGTVLNHSGVSQQELVVYAVARRAGRIVAAGRAVLPQAPTGASTRFQLFFIGDPRGAQLQLSAPATTLG